MKTESSGQPKRFRPFHNWISVGGLIVAVGSIFAFLLLLATDLFAHHGNPYMGILAYVVAPGIFFFGMFLTLLGAWWNRRQWRKAGEPLVPSRWVIDLSRIQDKRVLMAFIIGGVAFLLLSAIGSTRTYQYTESQQFCGQACHGPMKPEFTAYLNSPHARVACVECHVGPGAAYYVKSKINGVHQLYCALTDKMDRPIKTPVKSIRPAQDTCEQCHWPEKFTGFMERKFSHYLTDETNTLFTVRLVLNVGGATASKGRENGIHWHTSLSNRVEYVTADERRLIIPWVRVTDANGKVTEFATADYKASASDQARRTMDCMDCHNRPAHSFLSPNAAVDRALAAGKIDATIPWVKSNLVAVLIAPYATEDEALQKIGASLQTRYPTYPKLGGLTAETKQIFQQSFFPEMKTDWRSHPDFLGHKEWNGCFRCHDGKHKTADGKRTLGSSNCNACHAIVAQGSDAQLEKVDFKGLNFFHIDSVNLDPTCANCHTGAFPKDL